MARQVHLYLPSVHVMGTLSIQLISDETQNCKCVTLTDLFKCWMVTGSEGAVISLSNYAGTYAGDTFGNMGCEDLLLCEDRLVSVFGSMAVKTFLSLVCSELSITLSL